MSNGYYSNNNRNTGRYDKATEQQIVSLIFFTVGLLILIVGTILFIKGYERTKQWEKIGATITKIEKYYDSDDESYKHTTYVSYKYKGQNYSDIRLGSYDSTMYEGKEITIIINPENPKMVSSRYGMMIAGGIVYLFGFAFFIVGALVYGFSKTRKNILR